MAQNDCENCKLRARFDNNPKSILGRVWRWHINFCPGWKRYYQSLSPEEQKEVAAKYNFNKYL
ncbi:MAG: hypothetical protein PVJ68_07225 [Candidatus Thiodiazotropha sp.]|jgi:hypothetical protein